MSPLDYYNVDDFWETSRIGKSGTMRLGYDDAARMAYDMAIAQYENAFNAEQAELAFNRQKQLINEQNAYNTPKNQLARYIDAGLNPSMIYGQVSPGLQSQTASYQPQRAAHIDNNMPGTTEKLSRAMSVINTIGSLFSNAASVASQFAGVRNQNLQNQILEARLPAEQFKSAFESLFYNTKETYLYDMMPHYDENNQLVRVGTGDLMSILFPDMYRGQNLQAKTNYQNWWNDNISQYYKEWMQGRASKSMTDSNIQSYNEDMLESLPAPVRPYFSMLMQFLRLFVH